MYELMVKLNFSAAHRVEDYPGNCERLHGHNWVVKIYAKKEELDNLGMVVDFRALKEKTKAVLSRLDHHFLNDVPPFDKINPT
ncbi:MAG: 6-carboxytetrahydropterin synthase, partial [Acidobacteria bacterium]|nr:6-carboxytetrahydropterin synthase [Acidobacteriota bacterium]